MAVTVDNTKGAYILAALAGSGYVPLSGGTMTGSLTLPAGAVGTPQLMFTGAGATTGFYSTGSNNVSLAVNGTRVFSANDGIIWAEGVTGLGIASNTAAFYVGGSGDLRLYRDAAAVLAQRNGTNAQTLRVYSTYTSASVYERLSLSATATTGATIAVETLGATANLDLSLVTPGTGVVRFGTHSAIAAETVTGYITVKDSGGTTRKLAVVS